MAEEKEGTKEELPSLPSNYVSLAQLRERWLKQQQKKKQKNERGRGEQQRSEKAQAEEYEEKNRRRRNENREISPAGVNSPSDSRRHSRRSGSRGKNRRDGPVRVYGEPELMNPMEEESQIKDIVDHEEEPRKAEELVLQKKIKGKKKGKTGKPRTVETPNLDERTAHVQSDDKMSGNEGIGNRFRRHDVRWVWDQKKAPVHQTALLAENFEDLSMDGGKGGSVRSHVRSIGGSGRFDVRKSPRHIDNNFVWIRKGDRTETTDVAGVRNSGKIIMDSEDYRSDLRG